MTRLRTLFVATLVGAFALSLSASVASAVKGGKSADKRQDATAKAKGKGKGAAASTAKAGNAAGKSNKDGSKRPHGADDAAPTTTAK